MFLWSKLQIEEKCRGLRLLDIGPSDGFFSKMAKACGADVTALDYRQKDEHGFGVMEELAGSTFNYIEGNIYELDSLAPGPYDIVLCLGVLYHLPDIFLALHKIHTVTNGIVFFETWFEKDFSSDVAAARYHRADTAGGDLTNFWSPNRQCVRDMLYDAGFDVLREDSWGTRLFVETRANADWGRRHKLATAYQKTRP